MGKTPFAVAVVGGVAVFFFVLLVLFESFSRGCENGGGVAVGTVAGPRCIYLR